MPAQVDYRLTPESLPAEVVDNRSGRRMGDRRDCTSQAEPLRRDRFVTITEASECLGGIHPARPVDDFDAGGSEPVDDRLCCLILCAIGAESLECLIETSPSQPIERC